MRLKITKRALEALNPDGRTYVFDTELRGLMAILHPGGEVAFAIQYRPHPGGRSAPKRRFKFGTLGKDMTVDEARKEAQRLLGLVRDGADPAAERKTARVRTVVTVAEAIEASVALFAKPRQKSWAQTSALLSRVVVPEIGATDISQLGRRDVARVIDAAGKRGPVLANRVHAHLRSFCRWCVERGHLETSPMADLRRPAEEHSRERVLDDGEIAEVWRAAEACGAPWDALVKLLILTGARRSEVAGLAWAELEGEGVWRLPAARAKNRREHLLGLPPVAVEILRAVPRTGPLVFSTTGTTPVSGFGRAKLRLDAAIAAKRDQLAVETGTAVKSMPNWTFHDLRRSVASGLARLGFAPSVIEGILNHTSGVRGGLHGVYNRHRYLEEGRLALAAWANHLDAMVSDRPEGANVVALRR